MRPMEEADVIAAEAVSWAAFRDLWPVEQLPTPEQEPALTVRGRLRVAHLLATDPGGAWVATDAEGTIVGTALAVIRDDLWGLSMLAVAPDQQGGGIGVRLLDAAHAYGAHCTAKIILSSSNHRAMRAYHRLGLEIRPSLEASGQVNRARIPAGLRSRAGDPTADADVIEEAAQAVRGASYASDIAAAMAGGAELLVFDDRGFALSRDGSPYLVAARDEEAATDLAWSCLALAGPGETVNIMFITEGNDWALRVALDAGFTVSPDGPVFASGIQGSMAPFLPSGAYL